MPYPYEFQHGQSTMINTTGDVDPDGGDLEEVIIDEVLDDDLVVRFVGTDDVIVINKTDAGPPFGSPCGCRS